MGRESAMAEAMRRRKLELELELRARLEGCRVAVDIQHAHRGAPHANDSGAAFVLASGGKATEVQLATDYAQALAGRLTQMGAAVLVNNPATGELCGPYSRRIRTAIAFGADVYLACHVNAGGGSYAAVEYIVGTAGNALGGWINSTLSGRFREIRVTKCVPIADNQRGAVCVRGFPHALPALILEPFFGDSPKMQPLAAHPRLVELGEAIADGVWMWWRSRSRPPA